MKAKQFVEMLRARVKESSLTKVARECGVSKSYLCEVIKHDKAFGEKLVEGAGYEYEIRRVRK